MDRGVRQAIVHGVANSRNTTNTFTFTVLFTKRKHLDTSRAKMQLDREG